MSWHLVDSGVQDIENLTAWVTASSNPVSFTAAELDTQSRRYQICHCPLCVLYCTILDPAVFFSPTEKQKQDLASWQYLDSLESFGDSSFLARTWQILTCRAYFLPTVAYLHGVTNPGNGCDCLHFADSETHGGEMACPHFTYSRWWNHTSKIVNYHIASWPRFMISGSWVMAPGSWFMTHEHCPKAMFWWYFLPRGFLPRFLCPWQ